MPCNSGRSGWFNSSYILAKAWWTNQRWSRYYEGATSRRGRGRRGRISMDHSDETQLVWCHRGPHSRCGRVRDKIQWMRALSRVSFCPLWCRASRFLSVITLLRLSQSLYHFVFLHPLHPFVLSLRTPRSSSRSPRLICYFLLFWFTLFFCFSSMNRVDCCCRVFSTFLSLEIIVTSIVSSS